MTSSRAVLLILAVTAALLALPGPAAAQLSRPTGLDATVDTERVRVHYTTDPSSPDATDEAFARSGAESTERAYELLVVEEGWTAPADDGDLGGDGRIDVYIRELFGPDGQADADRSCDLPGCSSVSGYFSLDPQFLGGELDGLVIHELHHVIQSAISQGTEPWFKEATSTYEEVENSDRVRTFDVGEYARTTTTPLDRAESVGEGFDPQRFYGSHVLLQWIGARHGLQTIQQAWQVSASTNGLALPALDQVLAERDSSFPVEFLGFAAASAAWNQPGTFPRDTVEGRELVYPTVERQGRLEADDAIDVTLDHASYAVYDVAPTRDMTITVTTAPYLLGGAALVVEQLDGTVQTTLSPFEDGSAEVSFLGVEEATAVSLVVVNAEFENRGVEPDDVDAQVQLTSGGGAIPTGEPVSARVEGSNRYATAASLAALDRPDGADTVILARADDFPDALAASALSPGGTVPVLVTDTERLNLETEQALADLGPSTVLVMGGTDAVSEAVVDALPASIADIRRVEGPNRFATAADAASLLAERTTGEVEFARSAFLADGGDFAAALAAGPAAAQQGFPILLAEQDRLPEETEAALVDTEIERVYLLGGPDELGTEVEAVVADLGIEVTRIAGADRLGTV